MNVGKTVFAQLMDNLPWWRFRQCVKRYRGDYRTKSFKCADQFRTMAFAQLTYRESLRDIQACFSAMRSRTYHMGIRSSVCRSTLADANENRDWRIYADFAQTLIGEAKEIYAGEEIGADIDATVYALDSSTIDLCLSMFPWARFRKAKAAIKLHTLINVRGSIPEFIYISEGKLHDVNVLDLLYYVAGAYYIMDRAYIDFARLYVLHQSKAFYVLRAKRNFSYKRRYSNKVEPNSNVRSDQIVVLDGPSSSLDYPEPIRRIRYYDEENDRFFVFITNDFESLAETIAALYKERWKVELFFKWIKQNLRIKVFYGTSPNAVKTQIWIAVCTYLLIAIVKDKLGLAQPLSQILQVLSVVQFQKTPIHSLFSEEDSQEPNDGSCNQLVLFD